MVDLISGSAQMQQMILSSLPLAARRPEVIQQMLTDPGARVKLVEMIAKQVPDAYFRRLCMHVGPLHGGALYA